MAFGGWSAEALAFYAGLEDDNSKEYWTKHKAVYQAQVLRPMEELLEELAPEFGEPKIFRPYRDIRFSHDKTPYKTHIGATIGSTCYVQLSADGLSAGAGRWHLEPAELTQYRAAVAGPDGAELAAVVELLRAAGVEVHGHGTLKSAPRGYSADHPRIELLRHKGLTTWQHWNPSPWLSSPAALVQVREFFRASEEFCDWLTSHVGDLFARAAPPWCGTMDGMVVVREVSADDWELMRDVRLAALAEAPAAFGSSYARESGFTEAQWRGRISDRSVTFFAFDEDDDTTPGGLAGVYVEDGAADVVSMWVRPGFRGHGIGEALIEATASWAKSHSFPTLFLWVTESNAPARRLYERCGYTPTGESQPLPSDPSLSEIRMSRAL